jgi:NAD(P)-dependent dehydrogenase (short-subunit alcohol dehydrogenase family)
MTPVAVITGASSGIGAVTASHLAASGWDVAVVGRNEERTRAVAAEAKASPFVVDYDSLDSVRSLAGELLAAYPRIDVLLNNAGGLVSPRSLSVDGHERTFQHNHLAPFLLTGLLTERLEASSARVVSTASVAHRSGTVRLDDLEWEKRAWLGGWRAYGTSKLETVLFMRELAKRTSLEAYSVHPGFVSTNFGTDSALLRFSLRLRPGGFGIPAAEGAVPLIRLATDTNVPGPNGGYFDQLEVNGASVPQASDDELAAALWDRTAEIVGLS